MSVDPIKAIVISTIVAEPYNKACHCAAAIVPLSWNPHCKPASVTDAIVYHILLLHQL